MKQWLRPLYRPVLEPVFRQFPRLNPRWTPDPAGEPIFVVSMIRSGSVYLRTAVSGTLGIRGIAAPTVEQGDAAFLDERRLASEVGNRWLYVKSHLWAYPENLDALHLAGIRKLCVHMRDPRDAIVSWNHNILRRAQKISSEVSVAPDHFALSHEQQMQWLIENLLPYLADWSAKWLRAANDPRFDILLTKYEQLEQDSASLVRDICAFFGCPVDEVKLPPKKPGTFENNFRKGKSGGYLEEFTEAQKQQAARIL